MSAAPPALLHPCPPCPGLAASSVLWLCSAAWRWLGNAVHAAWEDPPPVNAGCATAAGVRSTHIRTAQVGRAAPPGSDRSELAALLLAAAPTAILSYVVKGALVGGGGQSLDFEGLGVPLTEASSRVRAPQRAHVCACMRAKSRASAPPHRARGCASRMLSRSGAAKHIMGVGTTPRLLPPGLCVLCIQGPGSRQLGWPGCAANNESPALAPTLPCLQRVVEFPPGSFLSGRKYIFSVQATNSQGSSSRSNALAVVTPRCAPRCATCPHGCASSWAAMARAAPCSAGSLQGPLRGMSSAQTSSAQASSTSCTSTRTWRSNSQRGACLPAHPFPAPTPHPL